MNEPQPSPYPTDRLALRLADAVVRWRWALLPALLLLVALAASGGRFLAFSNNYRAFFGADNPELVAFETFQSVYTKNDNILFVVRPEDGEVFTPGVTAALEELTEKAWQIPYATRVDSVTNFQHSWADGDELTVEDLIRGGGALAQEELEEKRAVALAEPLLHGNLVAPDAATTGVNVTLQFPEKSLTELPQAVAVAREIAAAVETEHPDLQVALSGLAMLNNAFAESGMSDAMTLVPFMYVVLILVMVVTLRSFSGTVATLVVIGFSTVTAIGVTGYLGIGLTPISVTAPTIILTLAIADSVHILISVLGGLGEGKDKRTALRESLRVNFLPVTITSFTTIVGFLSLNFSDSPPFRHLGNITAIGIAAAWLYSLTLLPILVSILPMKAPRRRQRTRGVEAALGRLAGFVTRRYRPILAVMGTAAVVLIALVPTVELNDEWVKYFDEGTEFRRDTEFAIDNLTGVYQIEYSMEAAAPGGVSDPSYLRHLESFTEWLRGQDDVLHVYSYADVIKRLNRNLHGDDPAWHRLPEAADLAAQYLLLYELSLPYGLDLNDRINIDKSATRVTVTMDDVSTVAVREFLDVSERWLRTHTPAHMWTKPTGAAVMFSFISKRNIEGMLAGNAVAVFLITAILLVALRSFGLGLLSLVTNSVPVLMTFGLWAVLVGQIGMAAATISATSLGIVVDDTVHFLSKYLRARREKGLSPPAAVRYAFETVGKAIVMTTVILAFGFGVLAFSTFRINAEMGLMTAIAIVIALLVDFLMLPALLLVGHQKRETEETKGLSHEEAILVPTA